MIFARRQLFAYFFQVCCIPGSMTSTRSFASILPPNQLHIFDRHSRLGDTDAEQRFQATIDTFLSAYKPVVEVFGAELTVERLWDDPTVNAAAYRKRGPEGKPLWVIRMYGGMARRPEVTQDTLSLVLCHELGHHMGGFPFYSDLDHDWAATEGESDYFATQICLKKLWPAEAQSRILDASQSIANLFAVLQNAPAPRPDTPDPRRVAATFESHPKAQCRLDTYLAGFTCHTASDLQIIPGLLEHLKGDERGAEVQAASYSCMEFGGFEQGLRPACWFKSNFEFGGLSLQPLRLQGEPSYAMHSLAPGQSTEANISFLNRLNTDVTDIDIQIKSRYPGLVLENSSLTAVNLPAQQSLSFVPPLRLTATSEARCGDRASIEVQARSQQGKRIYNEELMIGEARLVNLGSFDASQSIPDGTYQVVTSSLTVTFAQPIYALRVIIDLDHPRPSDLTITLEDPKSNYIIIAGTNQGHTASSSRIEFDLPPEVRSVRGLWRLRAYDQQPGLAGSIVSWRLSGVGIQCPNALAEALR